MLKPFSLFCARVSPAPAFAFKLFLAFLKAARRSSLVETSDRKTLKNVHFEPLILQFDVVEDEP